MMYKSLVLVLTLRPHLNILKQVLSNSERELLVHFLQRLEFPPGFRKVLRISISWNDKWLSLGHLEIHLSPIGFSLSELLQK